MIKRLSILSKIAKLRISENLEKKNSYIKRVFQNPIQEIESN